MIEIEEIIKRLRQKYSKEYRAWNSFKILIFTILSQRTRDESTYKASDKLFSVFDTPKKLANADVSEIEKLIRAAGFYRVKARRIKEVSGIILERYGGIVPSDMHELLSLPGVGRKTANCVLVYGFGIDAIPVDVHVHRISNRIGIVKTKTPEETERELMDKIPRKYWKDLNELLVEFGKDTCRPVKPRCHDCIITDFCEYYANILL